MVNWSDPAEVAKDYRTFQSLSSSYSLNYHSCLPTAYLRYFRCLSLGAFHNLRFRMVLDYTSSSVPMASGESGVSRSMALFLTMAFRHDRVCNFAFLVAFILTDSRISLFLSISLLYPIGLHRTVSLLVPSQSRRFLPTSTVLSPCLSQPR